MTKRCEKGQALLVTALTLTILMLSAGLAIDMGYLRYQRRRMQTAADSAAIAGASQLNNSGFSGAYNAAFNDAGLNGFNNMQVTEVQCPDGTYPCIQALESQQIPLFFMRIMPGLASSNVSALAVAETAAGAGCIYALNNAPDTVQIGVNWFHTIVASPSCSVADNGGLQMGADPSHTLYSSSNYSNSSFGISNPSNATITPAPQTGTIQVGDPLGYVASPGGTSTCNGQSQTYVEGTLSYPCGLNISSSTTLDPGLYVIGGGGLNISGDGAVVSGTGVTFYITGNAPVNINDTADGPTSFGAVVQFSAPTSGTLAGIAFFQDRSDTQAATISLGGWGPFGPGPQQNSYIWGALYFPAATLTLRGTGQDDSGDVAIEKCSTQPRLTLAVAYNLVFQENVNFGSNDCVWPPIPVSVPVPSPLANNAVLVK